MLNKIGKGLKKAMEKVRTLVDILASDKTRVVFGCIFVGTGIGLITSAYLKVPV